MFSVSHKYQATFYNLNHTYSIYMYTNHYWFVYQKYRIQHLYGWKLSLWNYESKASFNHRTDLDRIYVINNPLYINSKDRSSDEKEITYEIKWHKYILGIKKTPCPSLYFFLQNLKQFAKTHWVLEYKEWLFLLISKRNISNLPILL